MSVVTRIGGAALSGILFGLGLSISGMTDPARIVGFLDVTGRWDPTLAFVMTGALAVTFVGFRVVLRRSAPLLDRRFHLPTSRGIDGKLLGGAAVFGVGWGLSGFCPGPAVAGVVFGALPALVFVPAMLGGMAIFELVHARLETATRSRSLNDAGDRTEPVNA